MELTRKQQQHILNVLADLWGRENGVQATFTLKEKPDETSQGIKEKAG